MTYRVEQPDRNQPTWLYYRRLALNAQHALAAANEALTAREDRIKDLEAKVAFIRRLVS